MAKRLIAVLAALMLILCAVSAPAENAGDDPVLVTVNGEEIRESNAMLRFWKDYIDNYYQTNYGVDPAQYADTIRQDAMDYTLHYTVLGQKLAAEGKDLSEEAKKATLKEEWDEIVAEFMEEVYGVGADATDDDKAAAKADALAYIETNYGYTEDLYVNEESNSVRAYIILINTMVQDRVAGQYDVTDGEVEAYFLEKAESDKAIVGDSATAYEYYPYFYGGESYFIPEGYRGVTHILLGVDEELLNTYNDLLARVEEQNSADQEGTDTAAGTEETTEEPDTAAGTEETTEEPVTQEMVDAAKQAILDSVQERVNEIRAKLADGATFEDLILEYGTDPGMQDDATRASGYAVHADSIMWEPNFQKAAMALTAPGEVSDPVISSYGVHIVHYLRDIPAGVVEFTDAIRAEIRDTLENNKYADAVEKLTDGWIGESEIVWTDAGQAWKPAEEETAAAE